MWIQASHTFVGSSAGRERTTCPMTCSNSKVPLLPAAVQISCCAASTRLANDSNFAATTQIESTRPPPRKHNDDDRRSDEQQAATSLSESAQESAEVSGTRLAELQICALAPYRTRATCHRRPSALTSCPARVSHALSCLCPPPTRLALVLAAARPRAASQCRHRLPIGATVSAEQQHIDQ